jgi:hypothetical protein
VGRTVQVRVYAGQVVVVSHGRVVGRHVRQFGRGRTVFDPWHYVPELVRKPGALRNGAPFQDWDLPAPLQEIRTALERFPDGDRQFVGILGTVPLYGLEAVVGACTQALAAKSVSKDVVLNLRSRGQDERLVPAVRDLPARLRLTENPVADCRRYDRFLRGVDHGPQ